MTSSEQFLVTYKTYLCIVNKITHFSDIAMEISENQYAQILLTGCLIVKYIKNFIELWCLVSSGCKKICISSTSFQRNDIGWPQQPPTEGVSNISEKLDFL